MLLVIDVGNTDTETFDLEVDNTPPTGTSTEPTIVMKPAKRSSQPPVRPSPVPMRPTIHTAAPLPTAGTTLRHASDER